MIRNASDSASRRFVWAIFSIGVIVSVVLSIWSIAIDSVINNDGIEYVRAAELLSSGDWQAAFTVYKWPFYPWLMMWVGDTVGVSYETAGHVLNTLFFTLVVVFFVATVRAFGGRSRSITWIAMLVALAHPAFNEYRAFLIRDPGYLAAYLLAVCCLAKYRWQPCVRYRLAVIACLVAAALFRVEGLVFLFSTPILFSLSRPGPARHPYHWPGFLGTAILAFFLVAVLGWWLSASTEKSTVLSVIYDPIGTFVAGWHQIATAVIPKLGVLREFLGPYSADKQYVLFGLAVILVVIEAILAELTVPFVALAGYALIHRPCFADSPLHKTWMALILVNAVVLLVFAWIMVFLAPRYPLAIGMTFLIAVPFVAVQLWDRVRSARVTVVWWAIIVLSFLWAAGESWSGVSNFSRNEHHREAGTWLAKQAQETGALVTNSRKVAYYAGRHRDPRVWWGGKSTAFLLKLSKNRWPKAQFAAVSVQRGENELVAGFTEAVGRSPVHIFENGYGDQVLVYGLKN
jgi:hypothetical protein